MLSSLNVFIMALVLALGLSFNAEANDAKVVHGKDNRVDAFSLEGSEWGELSRSVAMQVLDYQIDPASEGVSKLSGTLLGKAQNLCQGERFEKQTAVGACSGFLVGDRYLVTAGHCVSSEFQCKYASWVFDYALSSDGDESYRLIDNSNIYKCKKVVSTHLGIIGEGDYLDYAVIKLDRPVIGRDLLDVRESGKIETGTELAVIGHPDGLPRKFADGARVINNGEDDFFQANLDTFHVNSGSPVFNYETGEVEGILVRGEADYVYNQESKCFKTNIILNECTDKSCRLEDVTRITKVKDLINYLGASE